MRVTQLVFVVLVTIGLGACSSLEKGKPYDEIDSNPKNDMAGPGLFSKDGLIFGNKNKAQAAPIPPAGSTTLPPSITSAQQTQSDGVSYKQWQDAKGSDSQEYKEFKEYQEWLEFKRLKNQAK